MLIKFFPNGKGGGAGPVEYLTARTVLAYDDNRDLIRNASGQPMTVTRAPLPEVVRGDPQGMIDLIDACPHKWTYRAGVVRQISSIASALSILVAKVICPVCVA